MSGERSARSARQGHQGQNKKPTFTRANTLVPKVLASDVGSRFTDIVRSVRHEVDVVLVGCSGVGKTAICRQFTQAAFSDTYTKTVIFEYDSRLLDVDGELVQINLWDLCGDERVFDFASENVNSVDGYVVVYDITDRRSFEQASRWLRLAQRRTRKRLPLLLIGNKHDLRLHQTVPSSEGREFAFAEDMIHAEVSARSGHNIGAAFYAFVSTILRHRRLGCVVPLGERRTDRIAVHEGPPTMYKFVGDTADYTHLFKIFVIGAPRTGKTSLRFRFCRNHFAPEYYDTAAFDYSTRTVMLDNERIRLQVWDLSGDVEFDDTRREYYKGADGFLVVYDITNGDSFAKADRLLKELDLLGQAEAARIVVANKKDLADDNKRAVNSGVAREWAEAQRVTHVEASARTGYNVDSIFMKMVATLKYRMSPWKQVYSFS